MYICIKVMLLLQEDLGMYIREA